MGHGRAVFDITNPPEKATSGNRGLFNAPEILERLQGTPDKWVRILEGVSAGYTSASPRAKILKAGGVKFLTVKANDGHEVYAMFVKNAATKAA